MEITFREFDPFNIWLWMEFETVLSGQERDLIEEVFASWFLLGKLGGFNAENLQVQETGLEISHMEYDTDNADRAMSALMHNMGEMEYEGTWGRCWFDLGTSDGFALDVLINSLSTLSLEYVVIKKLLVGGENADWPIDPEYQKSFLYEENN
jgi:Protein of unknown function (DUF3531)